MNFQSEITNYINEKVHEFTKVISKKYNISHSDLNELWKKADTSTDIPPVTSNNQVSTEIDYEKIHKYTKPVLIELCKKKNLKHSGRTKAQLLDLLTKGGNTNTHSDKNQTKLNFEKTKNVQTEVIRKNNFGNYEYMIDNTRFIIDKDSNKITGIQGSESKNDIITLCEEDIELIILDGHFEYIRPSNLDDNKIIDEDDEELSEELSEEDVIEISDDEFEIELDDDN